MLSYGALRRYVDVDGFFVLRLLFVDIFVTGFELAFDVRVKRSINKLYYHCYDYSQRTCDG